MCSGIFADMHHGQKADLSVHMAIMHIAKFGSGMHTNSVGSSATQHNWGHSSKVAVFSSSPHDAKACMSTSIMWDAQIS